MKALFVCFFFLLILNAQAQFEKAVLLDEHKGLLGSDIKLGMKMKDIPGLVKVPHSITGERFSWYESREGIITWYERKNEKLDLVGVKFESIYYRFENNKLVEIFAKFDINERKLVISKFSEIYGQYSVIPVYPKYEIQWTNTGWRGKEILLIESVTDLIITQEKKKGNKKEFFKLNKEIIEREAEDSNRLQSMDEKDRKRELKDLIDYSKEEFDVKVYYFKRDMNNYVNGKFDKL